MELAISMSLFKAGSSGAIPHLEQCSAVEYLDGGGLRLREVDGYGPGILVTKGELQKKDHYGLMAVDETGSFAVQTSDGAVEPMRRDNDQAKRQAKADRVEQQSAREKKTQQREQAKKDLLRAVEPESSVRTCGVCRRPYRSEATYQRHFTSGACERRQASASAADAARASQKTATVIVEERRAARKAADAAATAGSGRVTFTFASREDASAVIFTDDGSAVVVESVDHQRQRLATAILPGYTAVATEDSASDDMGTNSVVSTGHIVALLAGASAEQPVVVTFVKPNGPMPLRGFARKRQRKEAKSSLSGEQVSFLEGFCNAHEETQSQPRAKTVREAMIAKHGRLKLDGNGVPIVMSETAIFNWLKARWSARKLALTHVAAAAAVRAADKKSKEALDAERERMDGSSDEDA